MSDAEQSLHSGTGALDRSAIRNNFDGASANYDASAVPQARVREQLIERLDWIAFEPDTILDLGCGTGHAARALGAERTAWEARSVTISWVGRTAGAASAAPPQPPAIPASTTTRVSRRTAVGRAARRA